MPTAAAKSARPKGRRFADIGAGVIGFEAAAESGLSSARARFMYGNCRFCLLIARGSRRTGRRQRAKDVRLIADVIDEPRMSAQRNIALRRSRHFNQLEALQVLARRLVSPWDGLGLLIKCFGRLQVPLGFEDYTHDVVKRRIGSGLVKTIRQNLLRQIDIAFPNRLLKANQCLAVAHIGMARPPSRRRRLPC